MVLYQPSSLHATMIRPAIPDNTMPQRLRDSSMVIERRQIANGNPNAKNVLENTIQRSVTIQCIQGKDSKETWRYECPARIT